MNDSSTEQSTLKQCIPDLLLLNLQRVDAAVDGEYSENDRRLNWFLLFQAFLFQGYATSLQAITGANPEHKNLIPHAQALLITIIAVGLITGLLTHLSTQAGISAIEELKQEREKLRVEAEFWRISTAGWYPKSDPRHDQGLLPTRWGPRISFVAWIALAIHYAWLSLPCINS
ncbi:hypothetical protein [Aquabacterium sp. NJ1]|uniref:hypothetical protein n=1 Tax=Aquabacterium sp. NJ1 TaxID=1538295 RepID=UPI00126A4E20|nr:hypothetical protein [Aquabacterium sp. NJ1]